VLSLLVFGVGPVALLAGVTVASIHEGTVAYDFHEALLPAARAVLHGQNPYAGTTTRTIHDGTAFVYPPVAAYLFAPLALLPALAADLAATALALGAALVALAVLGVRDWRCFGCALLWSPVFYTIHLGAVSTLLALGVAVAWRYRDALWVSGIVVGLVVATKLFLWPLLLWLFAARSSRAGAIAVVSTVVFVLLPWAAIGFVGLANYPHVLHELSAVEARESYTPAAAIAKLGASWSVGRVIGALAALACGAALVIAARMHCERAALTLAIGAALLASPIVWIHYFALLLVVIPIYVSRFHPIWLLPVALFAFPITARVVPGWEVATAVVLVGSLFALAVLAGPDTGIPAGFRSGEQRG
jgi:alpha-1,2-mannosyltransferase